jgi:hypothetical protein
MDYNLYYLQGLGVSGITFSNNNITLINPTGGTNSVIINTLTGLTVNGNIKTTTISATTYQNLPPAVFSGGTVSGPTTFTNGLTASTISANTYQNLPQDIFVTGGTYTNGEILFKNNSGGNFTVTGLPIGGAGGEIYYLNLSQTQTPYKEFSPVGTNLPEQTTGVTVNSGVTSTIASFLTPTGYPNTTTIPAGYWSFYIHSYKDSINASLDVFCEVYVRTTGGTETLILTTEGAHVTTYSPTVTMQLTDGYYSGGTIDITDRILVKVSVTNTGSQTNTITFFTEGQQHYSYGITPFSNFNALTCETLSGCTTIFNLENNKVNKGGDTMTGTLNVPTISATTISANTVTVTDTSGTPSQATSFDSTGKLVAGLGQTTFSAFGSAALPISNTTTTFTIVPGLTQTFTVPTNCSVYVVTTGGIGNTNGSNYSFTADFSIFVDGVGLTQGGYGRVNTFNPATTNAGFTNTTWAISTILNLSAGSHTIDLRVVYRNTSNTAQGASVSSVPGNVRQGELYIMIIKN